MSQSLASVNIDKDASAKGLHESLEKLARARATNVSRIASKIYIHAVNNRGDYKPPLAKPGESPGKHIAAKVPTNVRDELSAWAKDQGAHRNKWCSFILQKSLENGKIEKIIDD